MDYNVADGVGPLSISQDDGSTHFGAQHNQWNLRFSSEVPLELKVEMGAGRGQLPLRDMPVTRLEMSMGAGQAGLDLTGVRKSNRVDVLECGVCQGTNLLTRKFGDVVRA